MGDDFDYTFFQQAIDSMPESNLGVEQEDVGHPSKRKRIKLSEVVSVGASSTQYEEFPICVQILNQGPLDT